MSRIVPASAIADFLKPSNILVSDDYGLRAVIKLLPTSVLRRLAESTIADEMEQEFREGREQSYIL